MHSYAHWTGLFLCLLFVVSPLFIPKAVQAAPSGVTVNRYFCHWMGEVSTSNTTWTDPEPNAGYYPLQLTFTPPSTANYLVFYASTLSNSSTSYTTFYRLLVNETEHDIFPFTPREVGDHVPFSCHIVMELNGGTEYTFKQQFKTSNASGTAYLESGHILIIQVSDYHTTCEESESNTTSTTYVDKATLTFTPSSAGDYLVIGSRHMTIDSVLRSFYTQLSHNGTSQGEVCRELTEANEYRAFTSMRVITFSSAQQTLKLQYKTEDVSEAAFIKEARITAIRLNDLGIDDNSVDIDGPETTTSETYVDVPSANTTFTPSPNQEGDYLILGSLLLNGSRTNRKAYARLELDGTPEGEMAFRPNDTKDYLPFIFVCKHRISPGSHTFKIQYKTESALMTVECQNAFLLAIKVNTIQSYSDAGVTECANYTSANHIAHVYGYCYRYDYEAEPPTGMGYHIAYYDNDGTQVASVAATSFYNRSVNAAYNLSTNKSAKAGTWHAVVYRDSVGDPASTYTANDSNSVLELEFTVEQAAIDYDATDSDTASGTFSNNNAPSIDYVKLYDTGGTPAEVSAMIPQVEYDARVKVTDADGKTDLTTIVVKIWYDADGGTPSSGEFDAISAGDAQTAIIITWTEGGSFVLTEEASSTWALGTSIEPADLSGEFQFKFTIGKVATETATANGWQIAAKVTDDSAETDWEFDAQGSTMAWYGEIDVPTATADWGTVNPGMDFAEGDPSEEALGVTVNYISNGAYDEKVKSSATWTSAGAAADADLATDGVTDVAQEFALKGDDTGTLASAVVVDTTGVTIDDTGALTEEIGDDVTTNTLWLKLASTFAKDVYSGTVTYIIADGS